MLLCNIKSNFSELLTPKNRLPIEENITLNQNKEHNEAIE